MSKATQTPMMKQYHAAKGGHPDCILFFRMGDFYEMFYDDAVTVSKALGLTLTSRSKGADAVPMAGIPVRTLDSYTRKLVALGHRVAICDQVEDAKDAKDIVERRVVRVVTPGTLTEDTALETADHNFLAAVAEGKARGGKQTVGLAWADLSTGTFVLADVEADRLGDELTRLGPAELLASETTARQTDGIGAALKASVRATEVKTLTPLADWRFGRDTAHRDLIAHLGVRDLSGFGCEDLGPAVGAAGALLGYLKETQQAELTHINAIQHHRDSETMFLDRATRGALELTGNARDGGREGTLLQVLDRTKTPMGARRLKHWVTAPLRELAAIQRRQLGVATLHEDRTLRDAVRTALDGVYDLERLAGRLGVGRATPRDLVALGRSLEPVPTLVDTLTALDGDVAFLAAVAERLDPCPEVRDVVQRAFVDEPPVNLTDGGIVREGYSEELDELRAIGQEGKGYLERYRERESERTGIPNLKVGFNRVFGFYIEITNSHAGRVPENYVRKQTLKNAERYITPELKEYESKVLNAEERIKELEYRIFVDVRTTIEARVQRVQRTADGLADLDAAASLAEVAAARNYVRPTVDDSHRLDVEAGRHPVLEVGLGAGEFVANDLDLDGAGTRLVVLTGPNMAGKSTYIRQTALHVVMAHAGSFVPADRAVVGRVDRVFTRVGASDDLSRGRSTFMVEMTEVANILNNATDRSLLVLDEVGRGTSTYDGVSIAWAVAEHLASHVRARTLFATHYHELTDLGTRIDGVRNLNVSVREWGDEVVFLHRIVPGGCDRSYGLHVGRLAGVPDVVIDRARTILESLQGSAERVTVPSGDDETAAASGGEPEADAASSSREAASTAPARRRKASGQLSLFDPPEDPVIARLRALEVNGMTPLDALNVLADLQRELGDG